MWTEAPFWANFSKSKRNENAGLKFSSLVHWVHVGSVNHLFEEGVIGIKNDFARMQVFVMQPEQPFGINCQLANISKVLTCF